LPGEAAPDFSLLDQEGKTWKLSELKGKKVVLEWYNHGCPFVRKHYDSNNMQGLQQKYKNELIWLTISSSVAGKQGHLVSALQAKEQFSIDKIMASGLLMDGAAGATGRAYGATTTPHMFILSEKGEVLYEGAIDDKPSADPADIAGSVNYIEQALSELKAGKKISMAKTKPYGCSVKY
jgi:peroxiredoxin